MPALVILAAGSLSAALTEYAATWADPPTLVFGPAGLLRGEIERGRDCDVYLSANMAHPEILARAVGAQCRSFACNPMRVVARPEAGLRVDNFLDRLLDPALRLGTSTPGADPSGDYAQELFRRAEQLRPGASTVLRAKAMHVVGGAIPTLQRPRKEGEINRLFDDRTIDLFICYRTSAMVLRAGLDIVAPPPALAVTATYGIVVLRASEPATAFVDGLIAPRGLAVLARHGFDPPH